MRSQQQPQPPTLQTLSSSLLNQFNTLSGGGRGLFKQLYLSLWRYLWPVSRFDGVAMAFPLPGVLVDLNPRLSIQQWLMLSRLYVLTSGGSQSVNSRFFHFTTGDRALIRVLMYHKMVVRTTFDPVHPHAVKPSHISLTYISLTPVGLTFFRLVVKRTNEQAHKQSYLIATGIK